MLIINIIIIALLLNIIFNKSSTILSCGIIGFSAFEGRHSNKERLLTLMLANMKRGIHATGMFDGNSVTKKAEIVDVFLSKNQIKESNIFIGHVRQASSGYKGNDDQAHPFEYEKIVGVHNGTLKGWILTANKLNINHKSIFVDSDFIFAALNRDFSEKKDKISYEVLEEIDGAATLIWADKSNLDILYVYRDGERPLYSGVKKEGIYFSSTEESLMLIKAKDIKTIPIDQVLVFNKGLLIEEDSRLITKPVAQIATTIDYGHGGRGNFHEHHDNYNYQRNLPKRTNNVKVSGPNYAKYLTIRDNVQAEAIAGDLVLIKPEEVGSINGTVSTKSGSYTSFKVIDDFSMDFVRLLDSVAKDSFAVLIKEVDAVSEIDDDVLITYKAGTIVYVSNLESIKNTVFVDCVDLSSYDSLSIDVSYLKGIDDDNINEVLEGLGIQAEPLITKHKLPLNMVNVNTDIKSEANTIEDVKNSNELKVEVNGLVTEVGIDHMNIHETISNMIIKITSYGAINDIQNYSLYEKILEELSGLAIVSLEAYDVIFDIQSSFEKLQKIIEGGTK